MVSTLSFMPEFKTDRVDPEVAPRLMIGAASPLWLMFGGAAMSGAAWWWWASKWREAVNVEALSLPLVQSAAADIAPVSEAAAQSLDVVAEATADTLDAVEGVAETSAEAVVEAVEDLIEAAPAPLEAVADVEAFVEEAVAEQVIAVESEAAVETLVEAVIEAPVEAIAAATEAGVDDLTQLVGIGPKLAASLSDLGVTRFSQIAAWSSEELKSIDEMLNLKGRADRDAWIAQAKRLAGSAEA